MNAPAPPIELFTPFAPIWNVKFAPSDSTNRELLVISPVNVLLPDMKRT